MNRLKQIFDFLLSLLFIFRKKKHEEVKEQKRVEREEQAPLAEELGKAVEKAADLEKKIRDAQADVKKEKEDVAKDGGLNFDDFNAGK
jgi:uncharacterized protein YlxW (UPF0749 family)